MELNINKSMTEYVIQSLNKQNIFTVIDFVKEDTYKLTKKANLELEEVKKFKNDFLYLLNPNEEFHIERQTIKTGIESFDSMLDGGLKSGNLYDICGLSASGKTQFCNSVAINLASNYKYETLYVDAKNDFSGQRIYNMLNARNCSDSECGAIMNSIRLKSIYDVHELITILRELPAYLKEHKQAKCLIVDSLPSLWFPLLDGKRNGVNYLCEATNLMQKVAFNHDMIILLVNIVTRRTEADSNTTEQSEHFRTRTTVALGKYWQTVPRQRFLFTRTAASNSQRTIKIIERVGKGNTCTVNISNKGVT